MESVTINGKKYVKAKEIARDLGYTADYVGQLCRSGKVDAQLVGRSWYVQEDSIRAHKSGRYRSNKKTVLRNVERQLQTKDMDSKDSYSVAVHTTAAAVDTFVDAPHSFYKRLQRPTVRYESDVSDLIPDTNTAHKTGKISVQLADAYNVRVRTQSSEYGFDVTPPPKLRFQGRVPVRDCEDAEAPGKSQKEQVEPTTKKTQKEKKWSSETSEKTRKIKVKQRRVSAKKKKGAVLEHNTDGVVAMTRARISDRNPMGGTLKIESSMSTMRGAHAPTLLVAAFVAIAVSVALASMVQVISVSDQTMIMQYTVDINALKATVYSAFE